MCLPSSAPPEASGEIPVAVSCRWCKKPPAQPLVLPQCFWEPPRALCSISQVGWEAKLPLDHDPYVQCLAFSSGNCTAPISPPPSWGH